MKNMYSFRFIFEWKITQDIIEKTQIDVSHTDNVEAQILAETLFKCMHPQEFKFCDVYIEPCSTMRCKRQKLTDD